VPLPGLRGGTVRRMAAAVALAVASAVLVAPAAQADIVRDAQYWLDDYGIRSAWETTRGAGVTIAVIDTGVDGDVAELKGAVTGGADFSGLGGSAGQVPVGSSGSEHGTMVASLAAGRGSKDDEGVIGAAPEATIMPLSITFGGEGTRNSDEQIAEAVRYAVDHGADIINMSLTRNTLEWPESWDDAFLYAMDNDVVVIAAAGNRGSGTTVVGAPATMPGVLTVGGVDRQGTASFDASSQGITIGVSAPSEGLVGVIPGGQHVSWSGTSGAAPIVAGIAALVRAAHPQLDASDVIERIIATAEAAGDPGQDALYGYGLVDAQAAVTADVARVTANPMGDLREWVTLYRRADVEPAQPVAPAPQPIPVPSASAQADQGPVGTLLPSVAQLRDGGLPLLVVSLLLVAAGLLVASGIRRFGARSRQE